MMMTMRWWRLRMMIQQQQQPLDPTWSTRTTRRQVTGGAAVVAEVYSKLPPLRHRMVDNTGGAAATTRFRLAQMSSSSSLSSFAVTTTTSSSTSLHVPFWDERIWRRRWGNCGGGGGSTLRFNSSNSSVVVTTRDDNNSDVEEEEDDEPSPPTTKTVLSEDARHRRGENTTGFVIQQQQQPETPHPSSVAAAASSSLRLGDTTTTTTTGTLSDDADTVASESLPTTDAVFSRSLHKSGSPSPWAVFDAWGAGADNVDYAISPEQEAKLTAEAVRIPITTTTTTTDDNEQLQRDDDDDTPPNQQRAFNETEILAAYDQFLQGKSSSHFGYPYNLMFDYSELMPFLKYSINNLGDPFVPSNYGVHSRQFEVAVIDFFAQLWKMQPNTYWGYVTTSGTEGNLHGILLARECFPDGILYTSQETHYSVFKAARYYRMECQSIPTLPMGEINYDILASAIRANADKPVILNVNIGTTVKGAVDNLDRILRILKQEQIPRERFYIHCDGALFALMMPFIDFAPEVSFRKPIDSIAVSGHKMLGCPMPCGVTLSRKEHVTRLEQHIAYLNSVDTTIMGSRNGQAVLYLWYSLRKKGLAGIKRDVVHCMETARYLRDKLSSAGFTSALNDLSSTVVLERPMDPAFIKRWQLACEEDIAHVVVMPNVTRYKIDRFVEELIQASQTHGRIRPKRSDSPLTKLGSTW